MERIKYIVNLLIVAMLLAAVAIGKDGRILGHSVDDILSPQTELQESVESMLPNGGMMLNSAPIAKDIVGYGGRTPVRVYLRDGVIERVESDVNDETPSFYYQVERSGLLSSWDGLSLEDAATRSVDVVSGATFTSESIIKNVQRVAQYGATIEPVGSNPFAGLGIRDIIALLVVASGVVLTLLKGRSRKLELVQLVLNVAVLGFWCGSFLSLSQLVSWLSNGVNLSMSLVVVALLCVAIVMPLFGRKGSYCQMHCPMGAAQELLSRVPMTGVKLSPAVNRVLNRLRYYILMALLFLMWIGVGFELMDYEIFSAFLLSSASTVVQVMAVVFLLLSLIIHRPYCRFVCPTGALITISQKSM